MTFAPVVALQERFGFPEDCLNISTPAVMPASPNYFRFGSGVTCYGRCWTADTADQTGERLRDASFDVKQTGGQTSLPFDPSEVADCLRRERYQMADDSGLLHSRMVHRCYYALRPLLPVTVRRHMQRSALRGWEHRSPLSWPVDRSVDMMMESVLTLALKAGSGEPIPFIWFWPEGKQGCVLMTHDVETEAGLAACGNLMWLNQLFEIPASFQLIPIGRYHVTDRILEQIRDQGFEVNVHDWNHDGRLFSDRGIFLERAAMINACVTKWRTKGFRSGALYRNTDWIEELDVEYDMSSPNVAHLDPQSGGCCTVFPWFFGQHLEIPVTMTQDYSLFHILKDYSLDLWKRQLQLVLEQHGMASFIVHPDYIQERQARGVYRQLLELLFEMRRRENLWITLPGEVNQWWRARSRMRLVRENGGWQIEGPGSERARIAFASLRAGHLEYSVCSAGESAGYAAALIA